MSKKPQSGNQQQPGERVAKVMARAGLCSRRNAEDWIAAGRVSVNGTVLESPAFNVNGNDKILVDGEPLAARERTRLFLFHKPRGTVTTAHDPQGRPTVFDSFGKDMPRVVTVGRLDINTEGLLLLTNDGGLARALELPSTGWLRRYRVRAHGATDQAVLDKLAAGVTVDGTHYRGIEARLDRQQGANMWLTIGLREGKNREVKKVLEHIKLKVNRLIRISFGPFQLGDLAEGQIEEVKTRVLKDQLGEKITAIAKPDFEAPVFTAGDATRAAPDRKKGRWERTAEPSHDRRERGASERKKDFSRPGRPHTSVSNSEDENAPREYKGPGKRKHVSVMRQRAANAGPRSRQRITRTATKDRAGRAIEIETKSPAGPRTGRGAVKPVSERNAKRFARLTASAGDRPRKKPAEGVSTRVAGSNRRSEAEDKRVSPSADKPADTKRGKKRGTSESTVRKSAGPANEKGGKANRTQAASGGNRLPDQGDRRKGAGKRSFRKNGQSGKRNAGKPDSGKSTPRKSEATKSGRTRPSGRPPSRRPRTGQQRQK